ncbi:MAG: hypothetical protein AAF790_07245 [Planctomycetota bacterium]
MKVSADAAIASLIAAKQAATASDVSVAVAAKALGSQRSAGDAAVQLVESAGQVGKAPGKGALLNASA